MIYMQHWNDLRRAERDRISCPVQGVFEKLQDCFADLTEPNCEGYLKTIPDSYTCTECSIGSRKNIFQSSLIHTSINSGHFIVSSPFISPMLLSNTDPHHT